MRWSVLIFRLTCNVKRIWWMNKWPELLCPFKYTLLFPPPISSMCVGVLRCVPVLFVLFRLRFYVRLSLLFHRYLPVLLHRNSVWKCKTRMLKKHPSPFTAATSSEESTYCWSWEIYLTHDGGEIAFKKFFVL